MHVGLQMHATHAWCTAYRRSDRDVTDAHLANQPSAGVTTCIMEFHLPFGKVLDA